MPPGGDQKQVRDKILNAFSVGELKTIFQECFGRHLSGPVEIRSDDETVANLLDWLERNGHTQKFLQKLIDERPERADLPDAFREILARTAAARSEELIGRAKLLAEVEGSLMRGPVRPILLRGKQGVGKKAIIHTLYRRAKDPHTSLGMSFKTVVYWDKDESKVSASPLTGLFAKLLQRFGHRETGNSKLEGQMHSLELEFQKNPTLVLIDQVDFMLSRMKSAEQEMLFGLWRPFDQPACFVLTAEKQVKCPGVRWGLRREVGLLSTDDATRVFRILLTKAGYMDTLEITVELQIVAKSQCSPGQLEYAADLLYGGQPPSAVLEALPFRAEDEAERTGSELIATSPSDYLAAALTLVPSRQWVVVKAITGDLAGDFTTAQATLFDRFPELGPRDALRASDLLPEGLTARAKDFLSQSGPARESLYLGMRKWVCRVMKEHQSWQRDHAQYEFLEATISDLRSAVETLLKIEPAVTPDADEASTWIQVAETVHDFGSWDMAAELMARLWERLANDSNANHPARLEVQLLRARHFSYRGETDKALEMLNAIETEAGERFPEIVVHARLRKGQSLRFSQPSQAKADLLYAMERGSVHDFLVAAGFLVDLYMNQSEGDRGELLLETGLGMHQVLNYPAERIRAHYLRLKGEIGLIAGNYEGARTYFEQASELGRKWTNDQRLLGWCQLGLGLCNASRQYAEAAELTFRQLEQPRDRKRAQRLVSYLERFARKRPPCLFILGGPAAGKTTLRDSLAEWLIREGIPAARTGIEEAQRLCFPPPGFPVRPGGYEYTSYGSLILNDRDRQIPVAYNRLRGIVRQLRIMDGRAVIVEFTYPKLQWAFEELGTDFLDRAVIFYLHAPADVRIARNQRRLNQPSHVPDDVVRAYDGTMDEELMSFLHDNGAYVHWIDATADPERVLGAARKYLEEKGTLWTPEEAGRPGPAGSG